jgi:hypothetical protein
MSISKDFDDFIFALKTPFRRIQAIIAKYQQAATIRAKTTGQAVVLQSQLNNQFDSDLKRIRVVGHSKRRTPYIYMVQELDAPLYLPCNLTQDEYDADFVVQIPQVIQSLQISPVTQFVTTYKLPSRRFVIEIV